MPVSPPSVTKFEKKKKKKSQSNKCNNPKHCLTITLTLFQSWDLCHIHEYSWHTGKILCTLKSSYMLKQYWSAHKQHCSLNNGADSSAGLLATGKRYIRDRWGTCTHKHTCAMPPQDVEQLKCLVCCLLQGTAAQDTSSSCRDQHSCETNLITTGTARQKEAMFWSKSE